MFAGIFSLQPGSLAWEFADGETLLDALDPYKQADAKGVWQENALLLAQADNFDSLYSNQASLPYRCLETNLVVAFWGRLDNRDDLIHALDLPSNSPNSRLILAAFLRWQENCPEHLIGDFAFAIADPHSRQIFLARDPLGVKPLYYLADDRFFAFASTAAVFLKLKTVRPEPDMDWAAAYLADLTPSYTDTAYSGVLKLAPGHCLTVRQGKIQLQQYFQFRDDAPVANCRNESWVEAYRQILEESVRCRLSPHHQLGFESSGGLDSSTVIGCAVRHCAQPLADLHSFSFAFDELEPEYIMATSHYCGIVNNHIITQFQDPDEEMLERALRVNGYPLEWHNGQASPNFFYRWCQQFGIRSLFSGFGGDECVTNSGSLSHFELLANRQYLALWSNLTGNPLMRSLRYAKSVKNYLQPPVFSAGMHDAFIDYWKLFILRPEIAQRLHDPHMERARYDAPYRRINDFILQNRFSPRLTTRLENSTLMSRSYGIDFYAPLLDTRLIQQFLSTPTIEKAGNDMGRFLHRRALEGLVPSKVQWKRRNSMGDWGFKKGWQVENLKLAAQTGSRELADLHPAIAEMIDVPKLSLQVEYALQGSNDERFRFQFLRNTYKLRWLNRWLHGYY